MLKVIKRAFLKLIEILLYLHGFMHFIEFGTAIYEDAYITASFAAFGAITMILGALFLGHDHHHHHHNFEEE